MKKRRRRGGREINRSTRRERSLAARGKGGCPARVNEHNPCHPDELRLEEIPSGRRGTGSRATCVLGAGWWCPAAWHTYSKPRRRRRRERGRERERGCSLCTRERLFAKEQRGTGGWWQKERRQSRASKNNRLANKGSTAITNLSTRASNSFRTRFRSPGWGEKSLTRCTRVATLADARSCLADFFRPLHRIFPRSRLDRDGQSWREKGKFLSSRKFKGRNLLGLKEK